jgi:hypothetical protein
MTSGLSCPPPSSLVHALCTIGQHQPVPSPNTHLELSDYYRAPSLDDACDDVAVRDIDHNDRRPIFDFV